MKSECAHRNVKVLKVIYDMKEIGENLKIYFCKDCGCIFKYRNQYDGSGCDCFIVYPGESERDVDFTIEEYLSVVKEHKDKVFDFDIQYFDDMKMYDLKLSVDRLNLLRAYYKKIVLKVIEDSEQE